VKTISIKVPNWFPTSHDFWRYKQKLMKWLYPPRCADCNTRLKHNRFYWTQQRTGTHPLGMKNTVGDFSIQANIPRCINCMQKFLRQCPKDIGTCTICETKDVPVMGYTFNREPKLFLTFLWAWWNSGTFCVRCIDDLLDNGHEENRTSLY